MMEVVMDLSTFPPLGQGEAYNWKRPKLRRDNRVSSSWKNETERNENDGLWLQGEHYLVVYHSQRERPTWARLGERTETLCASLRRADFECAKVCVGGVLNHWHQPWGRPGSSIERGCMVLLSDPRISLATNSLNIEHCYSITPRIDKT